MNVPKVRFKEFAKEWNKVPAEQLFENVVEKNCAGEEVLTIIQGVGTVPRDSSGRNILFDEATTDNYKKVRAGDFIIHLRSFQAGLEIANSDGIVSPAYTILRNKHPIATMFYRNYFRSNRFINQTLCSAVEGVRDGRQISYAQFKRIPLVATTLSEQQKIAELLSAVDEKIETQQDIVTSLENQKKGFMQKIFSQQLYFKDENGKDFPEWLEKKLGLFCSKIGSGKTPKGGSSVYKEDGVLFLRSQNILNGYIDISDATFISEEIHQSMIATTVQKDDILLNITGASIGRCCVYPFSYSANVNQHVCIIRMKSNSISPAFLLFQMLSSFAQNQIDDCQNGGSREGLNFQQIRGFNILLPSFPEQQKIADFLSAFDEKIEAEMQILTHWRTVKKGLLQQMFV